MIKLCVVAALSIAAACPLHAFVGLTKQSYAPKESPKQPSVRVLLLHDSPKAVLEVKGRYTVVDPKTDAVLSSGFQGKRRTVEALQDGLKWGEEFPGVYQIALIPYSAETSVFVDNIEYKGSVYVYDIGGTLSIVNKVPIEEYLSSVLGLRYSEDLSQELIAALAIAVRTQTYYEARHAKTAYWDIDAKKEGYHGYALSRRFKGIENAIQETKHMVLHKCEKGERQGDLFPLAWRLQGQHKQAPDRTYTNITLEEAEQMAKRGVDAADILKKAFPQAYIRMGNRTDAP